MKRLSLMVALLMVLLCSAVSGTAWSSSREGHFQLGGGFGLAFNDPVRFDIQLAGDYFFWENVSIGMNIDFLIRNGVIFVFQPFARYHIDIASAPEWVPYVGGGVGMAVSDDGDGALDIMLPNFGFKYEIIAEKLFLGTDMSFHILTDFDNTDWDFRWLIAHAVYRF